MIDLALGMCRVRSSPACRTERKRSPEQPGPKGNAPRTLVQQTSLIVVASILFDRGLVRIPIRIHVNALTSADRLRFAIRVDRCAYVVAIR